MWKEVIFDRLHRKVTSAALALIKRNRDDEDNASAERDKNDEGNQAKLISSVVNSYSLVLLPEFIIQSFSVELGQTVEDDTEDDFQVRTQASSSNQSVQASNSNQSMSLTTKFKVCLHFLFGWTAVKTYFKVYVDHFVSAFLKETHAYYTDKSDDFLRKHNVTGYMKMVENRLGHERKRCESCLHQSTLKSLMETCDDAMIRRHLDKSVVFFRGGNTKCLV